MRNREEPGPDHTAPEHVYGLLCQEHVDPPWGRCVFFTTPSAHQARRRADFVSFILVAAYWLHQTRIEGLNDCRHQPRRRTRNLPVPSYRPHHFEGLRRISCPSNLPAQSRGSPYVRTCDVVRRGASAQSIRLESPGHVRRHAIIGLAVPWLACRGGLGPQGSGQVPVHRLRPRVSWNSIIVGHQKVFGV